MDDTETLSESGSRRMRRCERIRILWRVERRRAFRVQHITAALFAHPFGRELRVFLGAEADDDLLHSEVARIDFSALEDKASDLLTVLFENGWINASTT